MYFLYDLKKYLQVQIDKLQQLLLTTYPNRSPMRQQLERESITGENSFLEGKKPEMIKEINYILETGSFPYCNPDNNNIIKYLVAKLSIIKNFDDRGLEVIFLTNAIRDYKIILLDICLENQKNKENELSGISWKSDNCADSVINKIIENKKGNDVISIPLDYSPKHTRSMERCKIFTLDDLLDSECELAYILKRIKTQLENKGYYVAHLSYPQEDNWYSCIYATIYSKNQIDHARKIIQSIE